MRKVHHNHWQWLIAMFTLAGFIWGCGNETLEQGEVVKSDKQRITSPQVDPVKLQQLSSSNSAFALDLHAVLPQEGNLFYSPISISLALAMTHAGAKGNTATEMAQALHFDLPQAELHSAFNKLDLELAARGQGAAGKDGGKFRLNVVNAIWGQKDYFFVPDFLDTLALNYGAGLRLLDYVTQPEPSRQIINGWVEEQTEERIKDLIPEGMIDSSTRLVLTNAIYFNAAWAHKFEASQTEDEPFHRLDGSQVTVSMMNKLETMSYAKGAGWEAVDMSYDGEELSLLIVVPEGGKFKQVEASLTGADIEAMVAGLGQADVTLGLPKFKMEAKVLLKEILHLLGIADAFTYPVADFSGMNGNRELYIGEVIHQSFIEVDELGTEAAAATAVVMRAGSALPDPKPQVTLKLDRPFLFFIRDRQTNAVLFVGRVVDPAR